MRTLHFNDAFMQIFNDSRIFCLLSKYGLKLGFKDLGQVYHLIDSASTSPCSANSISFWVAVFVVDL